MENIELEKSQQERINKIKKLSILLMDMEGVAKSELLNQKTRELCQPIIKELIKELNLASIYNTENQAN